MYYSERDRISRELYDLPPYYVRRGDEFASDRIGLLAIHQSLLWTSDLVQASEELPRLSDAEVQKLIKVEFLDGAPPYVRGNHVFGTEVKYNPTAASPIVAGILRMLKQSPSWRIISAVDSGNYTKLLEDLIFAQKKVKISLETENFVKKCVVRAAERGMKPKVDLPSKERDLALEIMAEGFSPVNQDEMVRLLMEWLDRVPEADLHSVGAERRRISIILPETVGALSEFNPLPRTG